MHKITIRNKTIGTGRPKTIVPIVACTKSDIITAATQLKNQPLDFIEWRADFFEQATDLSALLSLLQDLRTALEDVPLLVTYRRAQEGGEGTASNAEYLQFCQTVITSGNADLLDVELSAGHEIFTQVVTTAHANQLPIIASCHHFDGTPPTDEMVETLCQMQQGGADIAKLAVMPRNKDDLLRLLSATATMADQHPATPIVTMSMGAIGQASRVCGASFGSAMTFASIGTASAPGQISLDQMNIMLDALYGNA